MTSPDPMQRIQPPRTGLWLALALLVAPPTLANTPPPSIDWQPCGEAFPGFECAVVTVPLDYDEPSGETIELALARLPAADPDQRIGTLFLNPGGPGGSGVGLVLNGFGQGISRVVKGRFDILGFDPRGVGSSTPIQCFDSNEQATEFFEGSPLFPYEKFQAGPFFRLHQTLTRQCLDRNPNIAAHMSTAEVARDLDGLRRAVGDEKLNYLGFSYGTFLGQTYANLFPDNIRTMVIDGVLDPRLFSAGFQIRDNRVSTQEEFSEFLRLCDAAAADCALSGVDGAAVRFEALAQALRAAPLVLPDGSLYGYDRLMGDAQRAMYAPESWGGPEGYGALFGAYADAVLGDTTRAQQAAGIRSALDQRWRAANPQREQYDNGLDAFYGNHCGDADYPTTLTGFRVLGEYAEEGSPFGPAWWWDNAACSNWPLARDRYAGPWRARTSAPVLVVGNYFDGVTSYQGAVAASRLLPNSRLLSYAGWGHCALPRSQCVADHVATYLINGTLPPKGTVCPANPNPFLPQTALSAGAKGKTAEPTPLPSVGLPPIRPVLR